MNSNGQNIDTKKGRYSTLCRPDARHSCIACCPPIRPAGYDHAAHRIPLTKHLLDNTQSLPRNISAARPITGSTCWGLGFPGPSKSLACCLLHPAQNQGRDHRDLTGYGEKCRRGLCLEAITFSRLPPESAALVVRLAENLDSFDYSSPEKNPAFRLLRWGGPIVRYLTAIESKGLTRDEYRNRWPILDRDLDPARDGFCLEILIGRLDLNELARPKFQARYRRMMETFIAPYKMVMVPPLDNRPFVHQLGLPRSAARFLRTALGWSRATPSQARKVIRALQEHIEKL